jgi:translation initiation factor 2B subunit (eIF-2B alpha/beta/delta family)
MKRVNVTTSEELHEKGKELAKRKYGSFSHMVRVCVQEKLKEDQGEDVSAVDARAVAAKVDEVEEQVEKVIDEVEVIQERIEVIATQSSGSDAKVEYVEEKALEVLRDADKPLSVPDISERLDIHVSLVEEAIASLSDELVLNEVQPEGESGATRWELK